MRSFVPERRAVDAVLSFSRALVNTVVFESSPDKEGFSCEGSQHDLLTWAAKESTDTAIGVAIR